MACHSYTLPWPISVNEMYRAVRVGRHIANILSKEAREWKAAAELELGLQRPQTIPGPVSVHIELTPPNRIRRDLDNHAKAVLDLLVKCAVIEDDNTKFLKKLTIELRDGGLVGARVTVCPFAGGELGA